MIKHVWQSAQRLWDERSTREQGLLVVMITALVLAGIWYGVFQPVSDFKARQYQRYVGAVELHREVVARINQYQAQSASQDAAANSTANQQPMRSVVGNRANANNVAISRVLPDDQGRLNVWVTNVPAQALMTWLVDMAQNDNIHAQNVIMDGENEGVISAQILLARGGGA